MTAGGAGLCPGTGRALEQRGVVGALQEALRQIPTASKANLSQIMLMSQGVCQYTFVLTSGQVLTFADVPGGMHSAGARAGSTTNHAVLPESFTDLPSAIAAAESQECNCPSSPQCFTWRNREAKPRSRCGVCIPKMILEVGWRITS
jgi:hypothetical protein